MDNVKTLKVPNHPGKEFYISMNVWPCLYGIKWGIEGGSNPPLEHQIIRISKVAMS